MRLVLVLFVSISAVGCVPHGYVQADWIDADPPAPRVEPVPPSPFEDGVWMAGYWNWTGAGYVWVGGRWAHPPRAGLYWYPGGYVRRDGRYRYNPGRWAPRGYRPARRYVHPRYYPPTGGGYNRPRGGAVGGGGAGGRGGRGGRRR